MNGWMIAAIGLGFFGLAWTVDALFGTSALIAFTVLTLLGPIAALEVLRRIRSLG